MTTDTLITSKDLRAKLGGVTDMTIWRWARDERLHFPVPLRINKRKYWNAGDVDQWLQNRSAATA